MVISHKYKFIFIKTTKTAGTSTEIFLSQVCGDEDVITPLGTHQDIHVPRNYLGSWNPLRSLIEYRGRGLRSTYRDLVRNRRFYNHMSARAVRSRIPRKVWRNYYKFCVERNPWDKSLSHFYMINARTGGKMSFDDYIRNGPYCLNHHKYTDRRGDIIVDRVIKYESLMDELAATFGHLGVPFQRTLGVEANAEYRADRRHYRDVYSDEQRDVIERVFGKEISLHGYQF